MASGWLPLVRARRAACKHWERNAGRRETLSSRLNHQATTTPTSCMTIQHNEQLRYLPPPYKASATRHLLPDILAKRAKEKRKKREEDSSHQLNINTPEYRPPLPGLARTSLTVPTSRQRPLDTDLFRRSKNYHQRRRRLRCRLPFRVHDYSCADTSAAADTQHEQSVQTEEERAYCL